VGCFSDELRSCDRKVAILPASGKGLPLFRARLIRAADTFDQLMIGTSRPVVSSLVVGTQRPARPCVRLRRRRYASSPPENLGAVRAAADEGVIQSAR